MQYTFHYGNVSRLEGLAEIGYTTLPLFKQRGYCGWTLDGQSKSKLHTTARVTNKENNLNLTAMPELTKFRQRAKKTIKNNELKQNNTKQCQSLIKMKVGTNIYYFKRHNEA